MADQPTEMTSEQLQHLFALVTASQSMILAAVIRPLLQSGALSEDDLRASLQHTAQAALQNRAQETPTLAALTEILIRDLGLEKPPPAAS
jgi:hypothetical protein